MQYLRNATASTLIILCSCLLLLVGCDTTEISLSPSATPLPTASVHGSFVGKVVSTDDTQTSGIYYDTKIFIGFVTDGKKILGCITDGSPQHVTLFLWFAGEVKNGAADLQRTHGDSNLQNGPEKMHVTLASDAITGTLRLSPNSVNQMEFPNQYRLDFQASLVADTGNAGVYRTRTTIDDASYTAGWIVLPDGQQRGAAIGLADQVKRVLPITPGTMDTLVVTKQEQKVPLEHVAPTRVFLPV